MTLDTIVAPATPYGIGGIAIVRLSGSASLCIGGKLLNNNSLKDKIVHQKANFFNIYDKNQNRLDEVVCTFFKGPQSYTGEDVIEISCHGNPLIVDQIVSACIEFGARLAEPGEFTRRAFINGKMDLIQAESVAALIHSKSEEGNLLNLRLLSGELSKNFYDIQEQLIGAVSSVEFEIDISEEELQPKLVEELSEAMAVLKSKIDNLLGSHRQARMLNRGALVVLAGKPNVGKSTLLNSLSESDRAITSALPGTTRDTIDVPLLINGVPINLVDTAGISNSAEGLEAEGVRRSVDFINKADLVILVNNIFEPTENDVPLPDNTPFIQIINKSDLLESANSLHKNVSENSLLVSAKTGKGLDDLKAQIKKSLGISNKLTDVLSITTARQFIALKSCQKNIEAVIALLAEPEITYELISIEIREALNSIGAILGKTTPDDILNNIFNQFCVGK